MNPGEVFSETDQVGNATYYTEKTDSYTLAIGLYDTVADCSIRYLDTNIVNSATIPLESISSILPTTRSASTNFEAIKDAILDGSLSLPQLTLETSNAPLTRVTSSEKTKIMDELYDAGWPTAYTNVVRGTKTQNNVTATLYHTLSYSIQDYDYTFIAAKTALSVLITLTGLPASRIKAIITIVLVADGIYQTAKDVNLGSFDTYAYENKDVRVGSIRPYWAGRTVKWTALVGDIGASLQQDYENKHNDFFDNNAILETGLYNYFNNPY